MLALIGGALEDVGLLVEFASDGRTGLARATASSPDAIVLDWLMPGLDGISLCSAAREDPALATAHIVVVTGRQEPEYAQIASDAGADAVVTKPFDPTVLAEAIKAGIRHARQARRAVSVSRSDPVTGLRDERCFTEDVDRLLALQATLPLEIAVAGIDVRLADGEHGGSVDALATALAGVLGPADALYRMETIGRTSFAVVAPDANEPDMLHAAVESAVRSARCDVRALHVAAMTVGGHTAAEIVLALRDRLEGRFAP